MVRIQAQGWEHLALCCIILVFFASVSIIVQGKGTFYMIIFPSFGDRP